MDAVWQICWADFEASLLFLLSGPIVHHWRFTLSLPFLGHFCGSQGWQCFHEVKVEREAEFKIGRSRGRHLSGAPRRTAESSACITAWNGSRWSSDRSAFTRQRQRDDAPTSDDSSAHLAATTFLCSCAPTPQYKSSLCAYRDWDRVKDVFVT